MSRWLWTAALLLLAPLAWAQDAAPATEPRRLTKDEKSAAKDAIKEAFQAGDDAGLQAALAKVAGLPPLTKSDLRWAQKQVLLGMRVGTRVAEKTKGTITVKGFESTPGSYFLSGSKAKKKSPLLIALHGGGAGVGDGKQIAGLFGGGPCLSVFPTVMQKTATAWNTDREERYVLQLIEECKRTFDIDTNRIYVAGHSMGGFGSWSIGCHHADRFAAVQPAAGGVFLMNGSAAGGLLANLYNTPLYCYHSTDDGRVGAERALTQLQKLFPNGFDVTFKWYDDIGHGTPKEGYGPIWKWMLAKKRDPKPATVVWEPSRAYKHQFFWLWLDRTPGKRFSSGQRIVAKHLEKNRFEVTGRVNGGLRLFFKAKWVDLKKPVVRSTTRWSTRASTPCSPPAPRPATPKPSSPTG
ncbi:MAG: carboxylesterase family protein [Planctomycetota bacterium]|jgi:predicted esterase